MSLSMGSRKFFIKTAAAFALALALMTFGATNTNAADVEAGGGEAESSQGNAIAIGSGASAKNIHTIAIGAGATANTQYSIAIGTNALVDVNNGVAIGFGAHTYALGVAVGTGSEATGIYDNAFGYGATSTGGGSTSMGNFAYAKNYSVASGNRAYAGEERSSALGTFSSALANNSVALGAFSVATEENTISLGYDSSASLEKMLEIYRPLGVSEGDYIKYREEYGDTLTRRIVNMSRGLNDTDGVNVSQLRGVATAFGNGWSVNAVTGAFEGQFTLYKGTANEQAFNSIQGALDYLSKGWTFEATNGDSAGGSETGGDTGSGGSAGSSDIKPGGTLTLNGGKNVEISKDGDYKYTVSVSDNPTFDSVTAGSANIGGVSISSSGIDTGGADIKTSGGDVNMGGGRITNLAAGGVYKGSTDAVNGGQLWDAYQRFGTMENNIYREMDDLREDVNVVGAHAAALSGLHPIDYNPYEPTTLSAAVGTYRDEYAVAVGVFHYARENVMFNLGASLCSDGDIMGRAGVSFTVGKSSDKPKVAGTMNGLRNQVVAMQAKLDELEEQNARNEEIIQQNIELIRELKAALEAKN